MPDQGQIAKHYRQRAQEVRAIADGMASDEERGKLMKVAEDYEEWARLAEAMGKSTPSG